MYAYCLNNPVNYHDPNGKKSELKDYIRDFIKQKIFKPIEDISHETNKILDSSHDANRRPNTGEPGSIYIAPNGDTRKYGQDGKPEHDYDHDDHGAPDKHPHDPNGGHNHDWDNGVRGPAYEDVLEVVAGVSIVAFCGVGLFIISADDTTGIGVVDDFLLPALSAGTAKGISLIFG